ncbi:MAG: hypothetical protein JXQ65_02535 [Candidatus Marinimicrobia bacterium]|nr:hypothetical protein [Candidatus Neomarinimicrobiota bacterium]
MKKLLIILAFTIPVMIHAQGMHRDHHGEFDRMEMGLKGIDLSEQQQDQIHDLKINFKKSHVQKEADLKLARLELQELIRSENSGKELDNAIDEVNKIRNELFKDQVKHRLEVQKILTDEQKEELKKLRCDRGLERREKRMERRFHR